MTDSTNEGDEAPSATPPEPASADLDPANLAEDDAAGGGEADDEATLPETVDAGEDDAPDAAKINLGRDVIADALRHAPLSAGVYRMLNAAHEVLYVGKAKSVRKRLASYTRPQGQPFRIARMIAQTASVEFISTATETEALLLEANLIKQLRPRFNVLLRDDKSFPYILITGDHWAPQIVKHRGAQTRKGSYYGPFASAGAVNRTINALQRAFLIRSCTDAFFESRTRPCLLYQIKRCAGPCTQEIDFAGYGHLVKEVKDFLSGKSRAVKNELAAEMEKAAEDLAFERAALYRDRLSALAAIQSQQGINPKTLEEADVFALHQEGGYFCIEVFFFRTGQNWGNRAYFPRADKSVPAEEVLGSFLAQFYEDKPAPRLVLISHDFEERALLAEALSVKSGVKVDVSVPQRGEKKELVQHALSNAREALGRKLADTASQARLLQALTDTLKLPRVPRRIEVFDNSHLQGSNAVGAMIVAGPEGFQKSQYRKFNIKDSALTPGDDYAMMREVLTRRFKRLLKSDEATDASDLPQAPDLVVIDGGPGQLSAARAIFDELGIADISLISVAKGPDRDAGRETIYIDGHAPLRLDPRDAVLYFIQRLRDESHRFVIGSHRTLRKKNLREAGLQEVQGVGPSRKRALLLHFGTLKAVEQASVADLMTVPGISAETAKRIYDFFHPKAA